MRENCTSGSAAGEPGNRLPYAGYTERLKVMKFTKLRPFIPSGKDYVVSKYFFMDLGFKVNWEAEGLCELQFGEAVFLLQDFENIEMQQNYMVYINVDNLDEFYECLNGLGLDRKYPGVRYSKPEDRPWGVRELHLIDPAGVCWHFA